MPHKVVQSVNLYFFWQKPQPSDKEVWLDVAGGGLVAVLRLPGSATQAACEAARQRLAHALAKGLVCLHQGLTAGCTYSHHLFSVLCRWEGSGNRGVCAGAVWAN